LLTGVVNLCWTVGTAAAMIAAVLGLLWADPHAKAPGPEEPSGSGIVVHTEVTAIWLPQALLDLARQQGCPLEFRSTEELQAFLGRSGCTTAWFALTYRYHQVN
jgi:hypothetical protein